jgi:hypothetical protein
MRIPFKRVDGAPVADRADSGTSGHGSRNDGLLPAFLQYSAPCDGCYSMSGRPRIEGYAVVSQEGMIACSDGTFPEALKIEADQRFLRQALRRADAIIHGRHSGESGSEAQRRRRIVLTRGVNGIEKDPHNPRAILWNPRKATFDEAWRSLGISGGDAIAAVLGGTNVFGAFLVIGFDAFFLSRTAVSIPAGRRVFPYDEVPRQTLARHGLVLCRERALDVTRMVFLETWVCPANLA